MSDLTGPIPSELTNLHQIRNIELYGNKLTGTIPSSISKLSSLRRFDVSYNDLSGPIGELFKIASLETIHLKKNHFSGKIPNSIGRLKQLSWLDFSENMLVGELPELSESLSFLNHFVISQNMLEPPIPKNLCNLVSESISDISCDYVACPVGTVSSTGKATIDSPCKRCPDGTGNFYIGSIECHPLSQREFLSMFYTVMNGNTWPSEHSEGWTNNEVGVCDWAGIICDSSGEVESLSFPAMVIEYNEDLLSGEKAWWSRN